MACGWCRVCAGYEHRNRWRACRHSDDDASVRWERLEVVMAASERGVRDPQVGPSVTVGKRRGGSDLLLAIVVWLIAGAVVIALQVVMTTEVPANFDEWVGVFALPAVWLFFAPYIYVEVTQRAAQLELTPGGLRVVRRVGASRSYDWGSVRELRELRRSHRRTFAFFFRDGARAVFATSDDLEIAALDRALSRWVPSLPRSNPSWRDRVLYV